MAKKSPSLRILVPEGTSNYILNPSARFDVTGWNAFGSTISRTLDYARFGIASVKVITNGTVLREGTFYRVNALSGINDPITVSTYVRGAGKVRIRLIDNPAGAQWVSKAISLSTARWQRIQVTGRCTGSNDMRLYVETDGATAQPTTFYVDGVQMERKAYSTSFCDGDQPGCRWNIIQHASISTRDPYTREGGKWVELSGPEREEEDLYMTVVGGLGMPPIVNNRQSFATAPGGYFQSSKITERIVTLTFHAKHKDLLGRDKSISLDFLHALRQFLIDVIKPDLTGGDQDFLVEYRDGDIPLYFRARYDGGLEGTWDVRNKWANSFPLRLLMVSPAIYEDSQEMATIDFQESLILNGAAARVDGKWNNMNFGFKDGNPFLIGADGGVNSLKMGRKGEIFAVGSFSTANFSANAIDPLIPANYITYWDGQKWTSISTITNGFINDVAIAPNGYVYVVGAFTSIGGVAANRAAFWDGAAWNAMGTGLAGGGAEGYTVAIAPNGDVFVGGSFLTAGGNTARNIAYWRSGIWRGLGQYNGLDNSVFSIAISPDGLFMYVGGSFRNQFGLSLFDLNGITRYTVATDRFAAVGSGFGTQTVLVVIIAPSGTVYCGGTFTVSGSTTVNFIAQLIGSLWAPLGSGMAVDTVVGSANVRSLNFMPSGDLIAVGDFDTAGGLRARRIALWNGSTWVNLDIEIAIGKPTNVGAYAVQVAPNGDIYFGGDGFGVLPSGVVYQSQVSGITLVDNIGTAEASPFLYILGSGRLKWLENQTTKKRIYFDLTILSGEEVFIDFGKGTIKSTVRGDLYYSILPGSDFNAFTLIPGENKIACFITNDVGAIVKMGYQPNHWSLDASM